MICVEIVIFLFIGLLTGLVAGLLGVGGGFLMVPLQVLVFYMFGMPAALQMKLAIGTSLATVFFTSLIAAYTHNKYKTILWNIVGKTAVSISIGALVGAYVGILIAPEILQILFGVFAIGVGIYFCFPFPLPKESALLRLPSFWVINSLSVFIGAISSMLGLGGGLLFMPVGILIFRIPLLQAIGTSSVITCIISFLGTSTFLTPTIFHPDYYPHAIGYLYLPSFFPMTIGSMVAAPLGVKLARTLPKPRLRKIFAILLILAGLLMIWN